MKMNRVLRDKKKIAKMSPEITYGSLFFTQLPLLFHPKKMITLIPT